MHVSGIALTGRQRFIEKRLGAEAWEEIRQRYAALCPALLEPVDENTTIPAEHFLAFHDVLIADYFNSDRNIYWQFGISSADWALREGPLQSSFGSMDPARFVSSVPQLWQTYYSEGSVTAGMPKTNLADVRVTRIPIPHIYFEYTTFGYVKRGLEICGARSVDLIPVETINEHTSSIHYQFKIG